MLTARRIRERQEAEALGSPPPVHSPAQTPEEALRAENQRLRGEVERQRSLCDALTEELELARVSLEDLTTQHEALGAELRAARGESDPEGDEGGLSPSSNDGAGGSENAAPGAATDPAAAEAATTAGAPAAPSETKKGAAKPKAR